MSEAFTLQLLGGSLPMWISIGPTIGHPACRVYLSSHYTLPDMSLCLPIWDPTRATPPKLRHQS